MICLFIPVVVSYGYYVKKESTIKQVDHELSMELNTILEQWVALPSRRRAKQKLPSTSSTERWFICWGTRGNYFSKSPNAPEFTHPEELVISPTYQWKDGYRILYHYGPRKNTIYAVGTPASPIEQQINFNLYCFIGIGVAFASVGIIGGYISNKRVLTPLKDISAKATLISQGHYDQRINVSEVKDELVDLCTIINGAFEHIDNTISIQKKFTSNASHELRTPISILLLELESTVRDDLSKEELHTRLNHCISTAEQMEHLANSMLKLTRLESGEIQLNKTSVDLKVELESMLGSLQSLTRNKAIELSYNLDDAKLNLDIESFKQVITNLVSNAVSHTPEGGLIHVELTNTETQSQVSVRDNGSGIPSQELPYIFDRFYRADKARSNTENRSGLGLAICQTIIHAHDGTISIDSTEGEGTTVTLSLPQETRI